ncbi:Ribosome maturation factor RimP [Rickettsiales bacterium Ac37b]|nr:Ribosome maturation factor RimP [Rickettsiales bacterium Ac37b]
MDFIKLIMTINNITPLEYKIEELTKESLKRLGYKLVRVKLLGPSPNNKKSSKILQMMIERLDNEEITVSDCEKASHMLSALLDVEDIIIENYNLEVSSPGIDRPLMNIDDFKKYQGFDIKLSFSTKVYDMKQCKGNIKDVEGNVITIISNNKEFEVDFSFIIAAKLVLNDKLLKKIQNINIVQ